MEKFLSEMGKIALVVLLGVLMTAFQTHIILDVSELYTLTFITDMSFVQIFGLLMIISLIKFDLKKSTDDDGSFSTVVIKAFAVALILLLFWGLAYISFFLIT